MTAFDPTHVRVGPGTLYAAPLGTSEPTACTGAWPSGWVKLGYTDAGSTFSVNNTVSDVPVAEEIDPVDSEVTARTSALAFSLAENTAQNLRMALNAGITGSVVSGTSGSTDDGGTWIEGAEPGEELFIMLGWDALPKGAATGASMSRLVVRKALQTGNLQMAMQKAPNKRLIPVTFTAYKPTGARPFRFLFPADLAA